MERNAIVRSSVEFSGSATAQTIDLTSRSRLFLRYAISVNNTTGSEIDITVRNKEQFTPDVAQVNVDLAYFSVAASSAGMIIVEGLFLAEGAEIEVAPSAIATGELFLVVREVPND